MRCIGLFGGTFDPPHLGHLLVAQAALEELKLDRLFFIPAAQSPFKPGEIGTPGPIRAKLLRLATAGRPGFSVDCQELDRGGTSYTIDTLRAARRRFPEAELHCLIGADHVASLPKWRDAEALAELASFAVVPRPGQNFVDFPKPFRGQRLRGTPVEISASAIRERVRACKPIDFLTTAPVAAVIQTNGLYL